MTCQRLIYVKSGAVHTSKRGAYIFRGDMTLGEVYGLSERVYGTSGAVYTSLRGLHVSSWRSIWHIKSSV